MAKHNQAMTSLKVNVSVATTPPELHHRQAGDEARVFHLPIQRLILRVERVSDNEYLLHILSQELPFSCKSTLQIASDYIKTATDLRAEGEQDEHIFLATVGK